VVPAGGDYKQALILNQWFQLDSIGEYFLKAQMEASIDENGSGRVKPDLEQIPFKIRERAPDRLIKICSDLADQVKTAPTALAAQEPALVLSYVEDPIAVPYLSRVLESHQLVENIAVSGLERIGNEDAVKVLTSALTSEYGDIPNLARGALKRILTKTSDPALEERIRKAGVQ
jgi:hypothetical protein